MPRSSVLLLSMVLVAGCAAAPSSGAPSQNPVPPSAPVKATPAPASFNDHETGSTLEPGTYVLDMAAIGGADAYPTLAVTFTVPAGWDRVELDGVVWGGATRIVFPLVTNVFSDPCAASLRSAPLGSTVDDLATALSDVSGVQVASDSPETFQGYVGRQVELTAGDGAMACPDVEPRLLQTLGSPGYTLAPSSGERQVVHILDVDGARLVINAISSAEASADDIAELQTVIDSIRITP